MTNSELNVVFVLAHQLGVALEMSWSPEEMLHLWPEALDGLRESRQILTKHGFPVPGVVENVLGKISGSPVSLT